MRKWAWLVASFVVGTGGLFSPRPAAAQTAPVTVALSGTAAPAGGNYSNCGPPTLNESGQVAFMATLTGGSSTHGVFVGAPGAVQAAALQGTAAPAGGTYGSLLAPVSLNGAGQVTFTALLSGGSSSSGVFVGPSGALQAVVLQGTAAPAGGNFSSYGAPKLNGSGQVAIGANLTGGSSSVGIFVGVPGALQTVALQGTAAPTGGNYGLLTGNVTLNGSGQVAFRTNLSGGSSTNGVFVGAPGAVQAAALQGTAAPAGGNYNILDNPRLNGLGQVAFRATLTGGSSTEGIFVGAPGAVQAAFLLGTAAPAGGTYGSLLSPVSLNGSGQVAFRATLNGGSSTEGIFVGAPGAVQAVALQGTAAPAGGNYNVVNGPVLNGSGQVAFTATLTGAGVTAANDLGLYAGSAGGLLKVAREGDVVDVGGGVMRTIADNGIGLLTGTGGSGGQEGGGVSLSDTGFLAYSLTFTDGSSGVFVSFVPVPEPATIGLATAGLAAVGYLRRRVMAKRSCFNEISNADFSRPM